MDTRHIDVALNFVATLAINFFIVIPVLRFTLYRNGFEGQSIIVSLLLTVIVLQLYQMKDNRNNK